MSKKGLQRESNPQPLGPKPKIMPLDHEALLPINGIYLIIYFYYKCCPEHSIDKIRISVTFEIIYVPFIEYVSLFNIIEVYLFVGLTILFV